ncbi:MAG: gamma carbonic anhydrase family protein [Alphaproteobacteria bacterium]
MGDNLGDDLMELGAQLLSLGGLAPRVHESAFIARGAVLIGDVEVGAESSIWYGCVLRGDVNRIVVGSRTNIQDGTVIHAESDSAARYRSSAGDDTGDTGDSGGSFLTSSGRSGSPTVIGDGVTVGHMALLHACCIGDGALVGMGSIVMDGAEVELGSVLAAGSLVSPGKRVVSGELWAGRPARRMRALRDEERLMLTESALRYVALAARYREEGL